MKNPSKALVLLIAGVLGCSAQDTRDDDREPTAQAAQAMNWFVVAAADIAGGARGGKWGASLGSLAGPEGTVAGGVIGALVVGGAASWATNEVTKSVAHAPTNDPTNDENPFDRAGADHNAALDAMLPYWGKGGCQPWQTWLPGALHQFGEANGYPSAVLDDPGFEAAVADGVNLGQTMGDPAQSFAEAGASGALSQTSAQILVAYVELVRNLEPDALIDATRAFEAGVMAVGLSEEDAVVVLSALSIARHSTFYWATQSADPASPWRTCGKP